MKFTFPTSESSIPSRRDLSSPVSVDDITKTHYKYKSNTDIYAGSDNVIPNENHSQKSGSIA